MTTYKQKAKEEINWVQILVVAVAANLLGGLVFTLTENLMPGWVVYPILLIIGLGLLRRHAVTGTLFLLGSAILFLLIYLPFTLLGQVSGACPDCSRPLLGLTLFIIPLLTAFAATMAWRQARRKSKPLTW
jgi:hypothetical protein